MSRRLRVRHVTRFRYDGQVTASYNEARMTPITDLAQTTLDARVEVSPAATATRYWDYWGSHVTAYDIHVPHQEMVLTAACVVEVVEPAGQTRSVDWPALRAGRLRDTHVEYLVATAQSAVPEELAELARDAAGDRPPAAAAAAVIERLRAAVDYVPGSTGVHTRAVQAWAERKGVCQDLAHLSIGMLRTLGIPARYVSGYVHPDPGADIGTPVAGQSHAWVEWWDGEWTGFDPTNGAPVGTDHVAVARGRDYTDVPPHKGIYSGPPAAELDVEVEITRLA